LVQITIEYMIMIPMLILQIFLFPLTAGWIMNTWVNSRQTLALQETASHLGSSVHQVYSALSHDSISAGTVTNSLEIPPFIEGYIYNGSAVMRESALNSSKILDITLTLVGGRIASTASVTLGQNVTWNANSEFMSNSTHASLVAQKMVNGTILMYFEGAD
jgi:hypothetical protein